MLVEPRWLPLTEIIAICRDAVASSREPFLILDWGLLESAHARPENHWHYGEEDIVTLAVMLLLGIARNHPFQQGNKRTGFLAAGMFLELNGYTLDAPDSTDLGELIEQVITRKIDEATFIEAMRQWVIQAAGNDPSGPK